MQPVDKKPTPERDSTDESLRSERKNIDEVMAAKEAVDANADAVVERARDKADAVLDAARDKADGGAAVAKVIATERAEEDEQIQEERVAADETLRREREAEARLLAGLLPHERRKTDRFLLTERVRSDEALANRDDFMGMVSHDLRNLLSGIVMNAAAMADSAPKTEDGERIVARTSRIQRYVARMNRLIGDLVDVVSIDAGKLAIQVSHSDAGILIAEALDAFAQDAINKGIALNAIAASGPLFANFDHDRMLQVLANLIGNAIKFTPSGGVIAVHGERVGEALIFSITDNGPGIPSQMLEAVFKRFWQVGKDDQRGLGLGLYISKCIVEAHAGRIWVDSQMGSGSAFHFTIPAAA